MTVRSKASLRRKAEVGTTGIVNIWTSNYKAIVRVTLGIQSFVGTLTMPIISTSLLSKQSRRRSEIAFSHTTGTWKASPGQRLASWMASPTEILRDVRNGSVATVMAGPD